MKTLFQFLLYILLLTATIFSQNRISETNNRNFKELKSDLIKSERSNWKDTFREKQFHENNIDEKTVINKKLLENGFLLIKEIGQHWGSSDWVNYNKYSYGYDENNNLTDELYQLWNGSAWVNDSKYSYTYLQLTNINEDLSLINSYNLSNNFPNPFNPTTKIIYSISKRSSVVIKVYDILGNELETLVNEEKPAGNYEVKFDGSKLSSGIYFYQLRANFFVKTKKMLLMR